VGIYSMGENQFLPYMEGVDPLIVGLPISETWGLFTSRSWVFMYSERGLPRVWLVCSSHIWIVLCIYVPEHGGSYVLETWASTFLRRL
jgi:hypothetical protein